VKICSRSLFEDMQAQYKLEQRLIAQEIKMQTDFQLRKSKIKADL